MAEKGDRPSGLGWRLLSPCIRREGIHVGTSVPREALCTEQPGNAEWWRPDVCPVLVSCRNTLVSGLRPYDWMVGPGYAGSLELAGHCFIYKDYFTNLNRKGPTVLGGKQAKDSFVLRE